MVEPDYAGAKVYAITTQLKANFPFNWHFFTFPVSLWHDKRLMHVKTKESITGALEP